MNNNIGYLPIGWKMQFAKTNKSNWLTDIKGNWRDANCPCGSSYHFDGNLDKLFDWEKIHIRHMSSDPENHDMLSFYPHDMVIFYHSETGYVVERRKHTSNELQELRNACIYGKVKLAGA